PAGAARTEARAERLARARFLGGAGDRDRRLWRRLRQPRPAGRHERVPREAAAALYREMTMIAYVMGPSGAGKDTLLALARQALEGGTILFAHRFVTRDAAAGHENFIGLSAREFEARARL